jgi:hypothetical protein
MADEKDLLPTRGEALKIIGAIGSTCAFPFAGNELFAQHTHEGHGAAGVAQQPYGAPQFFSEAELRTIGAIAERIIPRTDTPGALDAGVPAYIDFVVARNATLQRILREGLAWLDSEAERQFAKGFAALENAQQIALLRPLSDAVDAGEDKAASAIFFRAMKSLTADGYYTSQAGLLQELGYAGNAALAEFPECSIPEH